MADRTIVLNMEWTWRDRLSLVVPVRYRWRSECVTITNWQWRNRIFRVRRLLDAGCVGVNPLDPDEIERKKQAIQQHLGRQ